MREYLIHYGVKGQKWGRRNWQNYDGSYTAAGRQHYGFGDRIKNRIKAESYQNPKYSVQQRNRDRFIYGRGGVRRINRSMNKGNSISGARSQESIRINQARARATRLGQVGTVAGLYAGSKIGGPVIRNSIALGGTIVGSMLGGKEVGMQVGSQIHDSLESNIGAKIVSYYVGNVAGAMIGRKVGRSIGMYSKGYSSKLYRYAN